jgi:hypothetical protein
MRVLPALIGLAVLGCDPGDGASEEPASGAPGTSPGATGTPIATAVRVVDEAAARGLDYRNSSGGPSKEVVLEANGAGVAVIDLGGDGDLDLVFAQGLASIDALAAGGGTDLEVFENDGEGHFERIPGPGLSGWWTGLAVGDVDGDGDPDLVAGGFGRAQLVRQTDGRLEPGGELLPEARRGTAWVTSLALFDADRDGALDLYLGCYLELDPAAPPHGSLGEGALAVPCRWKGRQVFCGPHGLTPQADLFLRGRGDGHFTDETATRVAGHLPAYTLGVAAFDAEGDGDTDLYVANDSVANNLLINDGSGRFTDVGWSAGVALSSDGAAEAGMGIAVGDVNRDGRADLCVTNFSGEPTELYLGAEFGFDTGTHRYGLQRESRQLLSWGAHLLDVDGDGWQELFTANGHVYPQADEEGTGTSYGQADTLWRLGPAASAARVEPHGPDSILTSESGTRGSAVGDFDGDGAPDLVLTRMDGPAALGINRSTGGANRLVVRCLGPSARTGEGPRTPADAMGTRVIAVLAAEGGGEEPVRLVREVQTAVGFQSASTSWLHFGLGSAQRYESLEIRWPSGRVETLAGGAANRTLIVREGEGQVGEEAWR